MGIPIHTVPFFSSTLFICSRSGSFTKHSSGPVCICVVVDTICGIFSARHSSRSLRITVVLPPAPTTLTMPVLFFPHILAIGFDTAPVSNAFQRLSVHFHPFSSKLYISPVIFYSPSKSAIAIFSLVIGRSLCQHPVAL